MTTGDELELMCRSSKGVLDVTGNSNWKTCLWKRERDSRFCLMEYNCVQHCNSVFEREVWEVTTNCDTGLKDVTYFGSDPNKENHICGIWVPSSTLDDGSAWTCDLEECSTVGGCHMKNGSGTHARATMNVTIHHANYKLN